MTVCSELHAIGKPRGYVLHELKGETGIAQSNEIRKSSALRRHCRPRPHVANAESPLFFGNVFRFCIDERPNFIGLDAASFEIADMRSRDGFLCKR